MQVQVVTPPNTVQPPVHEPVQHGSPFVVQVEPVGRHDDPHEPAGGSAHAPHWPVVAGPPSSIPEAPAPGAGKVQSANPPGQQGQSQSLAHV